MDVGQTVKRHWPWALIPLLGSLLLAAYKYLEVTASGRYEPLSAITLKEVTSAVGTVLLLWPMVELHRRAPLFHRGGWRSIPIHALGVVLYSVLHTSWNWGVREASYAVLRLGDFDYGHMPTRYLQEFPLDLIVYVLVGVVVLVVQRSASVREREVQMARLQEQLQRAQLTQLQGQLRPHFLFNSLNTVSSVMYEDVERADEVLQALSDLLRRMVDQSDRTEVPLDEELALIRAMVRIMEARFHSRLQVRIDADPSVGDWPVPPLVLQPLVENAIQHGMGDGRAVLEITVRARPAGERLRLEVEDTGPGLTGDPFASGGVGLRATRDRLRTQYGDRMDFAIESPPDGGVRVVIEVP